MSGLAIGTLKVMWRVAKGDSNLETLYENGTHGEASLLNREPTPGSIRSHLVQISILGIFAVIVRAIFIWHDPTK